jgi:Tol biopolymer transport system component
MICGAISLPVICIPARASSPQHAPVAELAFASRRDGNWEIYVMDSAGQSQRLTHRDAQDRFPLWSPDGAQIAFGSQIGEGWELWVMDSNGTGEKRLYSQIVAKSARGWCRNRIAFAADVGGNIDVYTVDVGSTSVTRLTSAPGEDRDPFWSPDCQHLTFSSTRDGNTEIYVMRADGSDVRRLTNNSASDASPTWSPDRSLIAFVSDRHQARDLYLIRPDGDGLQRLTVGARATRDTAQWSPDGSRIAFQIARGKNYDIGVVRLSDRRRTDLANSAAYDGMFTWSPNSTRLAFISSRSGFETLYRADADGRHVARLTETPSLNPAWAPTR